MKKLTKTILANVLALAAWNAQGNSYASEKTQKNTEAMAKYIMHLGAYLGFNLEKPPQEANMRPVVTLIDTTGTQLMQAYVLNTFLGAIPVNAFNEMASRFLPGTIPAGSKINPFANYTFKSQEFNNPQMQRGKVSVNPLVDQKQYQQDPVNQSLLNLLATPDNAACMSYDESSWNDNCDILYQGKVTSNAIGALPSSGGLATFDYVKQFLAQLNSNTLTSPLMYSTEDGNQSNSYGDDNKDKGLTATNQAQQALNFIRYASGILLPPELPKPRDYDNLYRQATNKDGTISSLQKKQAQNALSKYLMRLRVYVAQTSVGVSNLYYIMSKRLPQEQSANNSAPMSQALTEFMMATRRLYNPDMSTNKQWVNELDTASPTTVQKEIAVLLAEINYQLYLNRQQEERMLLTNSLLLLQNSMTSQPQPQLGAP